MTSKCYFHHHYIQHGKTKVEKNKRKNSVHKTTQRSITYPVSHLRWGYTPSLDSNDVWFTFVMVRTFIIKLHIEQHSRMGS